MKFIVVVIFMLATQASASFLDKVRGIFQPPKYDVVNFVADVVSDLQESIDCTIMAVENVFSLGGMFAINPEYERRCKSMTKDFTVTPAAEDTYYSQETDTSNAHRLQTLKEMRRGNENATNEISKHVKESLIDASSTLKLIVKKNEAQKKVQNVKSVIKNETDRLVVISKMIRRELDDLSPETKSKFNIHDIDLEHVSVHEVLGEIGALYKVEQSDKSSSHANEIRHLFDKILNIVRVNKNDDRVYSDDEEVKEIVKNLEKTENNTLINTAEKLSIWKDGNLQNNIVHNENINKLQKEIDNIPKTFQDIAKRIFNQGSANVIRRSNASEIINTLNVTPEVKIQNMNVRKTIQNTAKQIMNESNTIDMNQILKSNQQARNIFNKSIKEQNSDSLESFHKNKDKILKLSMEQKQNLNITNRSQDTAIHVLEESHIVDTDRIVKSTAEAINIISHSDNQQQKYYSPNMAQTSVDDMAEKKYLNVDIIKSFQHTTSQIVEESKIRDKTKEHGQAFVSNSAPEENSNALEASKKQKENVNVANRFESISNQVMEDLKSVDIDQIVKSAEEATKIFSQASNDQQNYYVSNIVQTSIDDIFQDSEKEFKNIDVANSFQNTVSHIMEESKTENTTKAQEEAFISNSIQENVNNIFDDLTEQKENLDLANSFQSIANEIIEKAKPVDTDNIVKTIEEAINISSQSPNEQQKYYDSNIEQASVFQNTASKIMEGPKTVDSTKEQEQAFASNSIQESANNIFENSRKQKENVDIASSFQSIANEAIEVSKPVDIDDIVKSTEEATNIYSQSSNEQQNYYVSNIVQASVDDIFKDSEKEYQNVGVVDSFQNAASEVMELLKIENTTKEQEQAFVSNSIQESANNIFEDSRKQKENVDIASSFQSIANELIENAQPVDTDQIVKSTEEATNIFSQSANEQQKYYDSNIEQASVDDIFKDSEKEYQNIDVANSFQNTISQIMEESKTENTTKEHEQAFVSDSNQENVDNIFEDSRKQKENLDLANRFQSIANDVIDKAKPVDTDQIVKTIEEAMNIFGQSPNEQRKYYDSNIVQASVFQKTASEIMEESKTVDSTKEQEQAFVSSSIQASANNIFEDSRKQKESVDIASRFQSIANEAIEVSKPVDIDQIVKSTEEATNIYSQSSNEQQNYYVSNNVQTSVDDIFKDSEKEYQNIGVVNSFQNAVNEVLKESKTENTTKEQEQAFVSSSIQESANNKFEDSGKQKENVDIASSFQSIANEAIEVSKPVDIDQIVKSTEEATNIFSKSASVQQKYYDSNIAQASVFQKTASEIMEESKTVDSTKEQEQAFVSSSIQAIANNIFEDSRKQKESVDIASSFQSIANEAIEVSKPVDIDHIVKSTEEATNIFSQSENVQQKYYDSNIAQASVFQKIASEIMEESKTVDSTKEQEQAFVSSSIQASANNIFEDSRKQKENVDIASSFQSIANEAIEVSKPVDIDHIVKSTEEATNIFSQSENVQQKYYDSNIAQASVFQKIASEIMEESKTVDSTKEQEQAFVSSSIQASANNIFEDSRKQKENVDIASSFQSIANEAIEVSKPVDIDHIVKSTEEATNIFSQSENVQQKYYDSNIAQASVFQKIASEIMEESKTVDSTKEQEQAFVSSSIQAIANNIFEDSRKHKENVDIASTSQAITNQIMNESKSVDVDQILKLIKEAINVLSPSTIREQKYVSNHIRARVDKIFQDTEKECDSVDNANNFQNTASRITEESKTEQELAFISNSIQDYINNSFEDSKKQKRTADLVNSFQSIANEAIKVSEPVDTDQIVKSTEEATNVFSQSNNEQQTYYVSNTVQESVDDIFKDTEKEYQNIGVVNSFQNAATQVMEESTTENTTKEQEQAFVSSIIQKSANNIFDDSRKQEENEDIESSFQSIANEVIEKAKPVDTDQIVKTVKEATNIFSQSANEQQTYYVSNNVQASIDDMFKDSEKEYQNIDVVNSFQNAASQIIEESKTENTTKEQEQVFDSNNTQEKVSNTFEDLDQRKEDVDIANSFQSITNQVVEEFKPVDTYQIVKLTEEALNIFNQSTNEQNSFQNTVSQITEGKVTVDSTKSQGHAFVSNDVQVNKKLENTKKVKANVNVLNSFQSIATQMPKKLKSAYKQQKVNSTKEAMNISQLTKDQKKSLHSSQDNLNKTFKQLKSEVPQPSVPAHAQGLNGIGVNPPISKNYMSRAPSIPPPAVTSAHTTTSTTTTTTTEIPDYDDYDEETDTDGLSLLSLFFGSGSEEDNAMNAKEAESIIERSRHSKEYFNKVNMKNARNVFANP